MAVCWALPAWVQDGNLGRTLMVAKGCGARDKDRPSVQQETICAILLNCFYPKAFMICTGDQIGWSHVAGAARPEIFAVIYLICTGDHNHATTESSHM